MFKITQAAQHQRVKKHSTISVDGTVVSSKAVVLKRYKMTRCFEE